MCCSGVNIQINHLLEFWGFVSLSSAVSICLYIHGREYSSFWVIMNWFSHDNAALLCLVCCCLLFLAAWRIITYLEDKSLFTHYVFLTWVYIRAGKRAAQCKNYALTNFTKCYMYWQQDPNAKCSQLHMALNSSANVTSQDLSAK